MLVATGIWKSAGWSSVIYLASIAGIDPELYEAATVHGANRLQMAVRITLPCLAPVIAIVFALGLGRVLNAGFDQILNLYNPLVYEVADVIDAWVYRVGLVELRYDVGTAVGMFQSVVGILPVLGTNAVVKRFSDYAMMNTLDSSSEKVETSPAARSMPAARRTSSSAASPTMCGGSSSKADSVCSALRSITTNRTRSRRNSAATAWPTSA